MIVWTDHPPGDSRAPCPMCAKSGKDKTLGVTIAGDAHGVVHCFRCGYTETRREGRDLTPAERTAYARRMEALRKDHDKEKRQRQAEAAAAATVRWAAGLPVESHPYLSAKDVQAHGIRIEAGHSLLVPLRDAQGHLQNLQTISPDGAKYFLPGGRVTGCYHPIGCASGEILICEGYATGATLHEQTRKAVAVGFNANNLAPVAKALRAKFPCLTLIICADDDWKTDGNPGMKAATEAARAVGGLLAVPDFAGLPRGDKDTDFNDLQRLAGLVEVQQ